MAERVDIIVKDKIDKSITKKFRDVASLAKAADAAITNLQLSLTKLKPTGLRALSDQVIKTTKATAQLTSANARLLNAETRAAEAATRQAIAEAKLAVAKDKSALSSQKLALATAKTMQAERARADAAVSGAARIAASQQAAIAAAERRASAAELAATRQANANKRLQAAIASQAATADRAAVSTNRLATANARAAKSGGLLQNATTSLVRTFSVLVVFGLARKIFEVDDAYSSLRNKLRLVTTSSEQLITVQNKLFKIAKESRAPVADVATAFQRFDLALVQLGASQKEVLGLTQTFAKAIAVSGLSGSEASNGIRQFTQALNKGKLDGDEFRSVMENIPVIADAIAKELGVARGELLRLAPQGKITSEVLRGALGGAAEEIREAFKETVVTVGQAFTLIGNAALSLKRGFERATGQSNILARSVEAVANNLKGLLTALLVLVASQGIPALIGQFVKLRNAVVAFKLASLGTFSVIATAIVAATAALAIYSDEIAVSSDATTSLGDASRATFESLNKSLSAVTKSSDKATSATNFFGRIIAAVAITALKTVQTIGASIAVLADVFRTTFARIRATSDGIAAVLVQVWDKTGRSISGAFKLMANLTIDAFLVMVKGIEKSLAAALVLVNKARKLGFLDPIVIDFTVSSKALEKLKFKIPADNPGAALADTFTLAFNKSIKENLVGGSTGITDFLVETTNESIELVKKRALELGKIRRQEEKEAGGALRGGEQFFGLSREAQAALEKIDKPLIDYKKQLAAVDELLKRNVISQREHNRALSETPLQKGLAGIGLFIQDDPEATATARLAEELDARQLLVAQAAEAKILNEDQLLQSLFALNQRFHKDKQALVVATAKAEKDAQVQLAGAIGGAFATIQQAVEGSTDASKRALKILFVAQKAAALTSAIISLQVARAKANEEPIAIKPLALAAANIIGASAIAGIVAASLTGFAQGGSVSGRGTGTSDSILARLSNGEFVVNAEAATRHRGLLEALNDNSFAAGGAVSAPTSTRIQPQALGLGGMRGRPVTVNVFSVDGVEAEVQQQETDDETRIDIILKSVDKRLASNLAQDRGELTAGIKNLQQRGF